MKDKELEDFKKVSQKRNFYTTIDSGRVFLIAIVLPFVISLLFAYIVLAIKRGQGAEGTSAEILKSLESKLWFYVVMTLLNQLLFLLIVVLYNKMCRVKFSATNLHVEKTKPLTAFLSVLAGIVAVFGFLILIDGCFGNLFSKLGIKSNFLTLSHSNGWLFVLDLFLLGVIPPICEEILFRGLIFNGLKERFSPYASIILTSLLFALMHQSLTQFIYPFILGIVLTTIMYKTGNLVYSILVHMFNNITTIVISYLIEKKVISISFKSMPWWMYVLGVVLAGATFALFYLIYRFHLSKVKSVENEKEGEVIQNPFGMNVGKMPLSMFVGILICMAMIVINAI